MDRIDQRKGYTPENSRLVAYAFNVIRQNGSDREARSWIRKVVSIQLSL